MSEISMMAPQEMEAIGPGRLVLVVGRVAPAKIRCSGSRKQPVPRKIIFPRRVVTRVSGSRSPEESLCQGKEEAGKAGDDRFLCKSMHLT
ncbi:hypothetical protein [Bradyrhizobium algeriense]|uniref:hypothetical protein n=1 Tax=Bradyrhizobium algeriense TaxID=634784 RepID=UPI003B8476CE